jgi:hypothetical protein
MSKRLTLDKLQSLSVTRPVLLELSEEVPANIYGTLVSEPWFQRVLPDGATLSDAQVASGLHFAALARLSLTSERAHALPPAVSEGLDLKLGRMHFFHGLLAASLADLASARTSAAQGTLVLPESEPLKQLTALLPEKGRLPPESVLRALRKSDD